MQKNGSTKASILFVITKSTCRGEKHRGCFEPPLLDAQLILPYDSLR